MKNILKTGATLIGIYIVHEVARDVATTIYQSAKVVATDKQLRQSIQFKIGNFKKAIAAKLAA